MQESLKSRPTPKLPDQVRFQGRILFLTEDPGLVRSQLDGRISDLDCRRSSCADDISTDEITPAYICYYYDETLGEFPYLGLKAGDEFPIGRGSGQAGGFVGIGQRQTARQGIVPRAIALRGNVRRNQAGDRREHRAHLPGELPEPRDPHQHRFLPYRRGCGAARRFPLSKFTRGEGEITRGIIEYGGLFKYNVARLQGRSTVPAVSDRPPAHDARRRRSLRGIGWRISAAGTVGVPAVRPGDEGFVRTDIRFSHEYVTPMAAIFWRDYVGEATRVADPGFRLHLPRPPHVPRAGDDAGARKERACWTWRSNSRRSRKTSLSAAGDQALRRAAPPGPNCRSGLGGDLPLQDSRGARAAGSGDHRQRLAHAARRRDGLPGVRGRHDGDLQFLDHEGCAASRCPTVRS